MICLPLQILRKPPQSHAFKITLMHGSSSVITHIAKHVRRSEHTTDIAPC
jgi:hypothetical protein